jgi:hypothetical protein
LETNKNGLRGTRSGSDTTPAPSANSTHNQGESGYLDEMEFRFSGRDNPFLFRDTLLRMIEGDALPYAELVEA